jgi:hypothetical protein
VLGLAHLYSFGNLAFFDCDGLRLFLSEGDGGPAESILYFRVHDVRVAASALAARGVNFINAPHMVHRHDDGTEEWMAFFQDNKERPLAIMSQADRALRLPRVETARSATSLNVAFLNLLISEVEVCQRRLGCEANHGDPDSCSVAHGRRGVGRNG